MRRVRSTAGSVAVLVGLLAGVAGPATARRAAGLPGASLPVLGFQSNDSPPRLIGRSAPALGSVGVDGVNLTGPGPVSAPGAADTAQLAAAHAAGLPAVLLVGNFSDRIGDFSEPLAFRTLGRPDAIARAVSALAAAVRAGGWNGVSVDLESLLPRDRAGLTAFVASLRAALPAGAALTVCIQNATRLADYAASGYDLTSLAASADQLVLMAYDEHGPWERAPGPVGALAWQRAGLRALLRAVPGAKVDLGVAGYGHAWRRHGTVMLSDAGARRLAARSGARARWVAGVGEWTAKLPDGSTVWWSDARSLARRVRLARSLGLHGLAVWSLGLSDPIAE